jgi:hypothetical protein
MNSWLGSRYLETSQFRSEYRTFVRESELAAAGPALIWLILDEHEASIDDAWFPVTMNDAYPFGSFPATRHDKGYGLNFGDGHAENYKLRDPQSAFFGSQGFRFDARNSDWIRLKRCTTVK